MILNAKDDDDDDSEDDLAVFAHEKRLQLYKDNQLNPDLFE
jgi:hypothetical protein